MIGPYHIKRQTFTHGETTIYRHTLMLYNSVLAVKVSKEEQPPSWMKDKLATANAVTIVHSMSNECRAAT